MIRVTRIAALALSLAALSACDSTEPDGQPITVSFSGSAPTTGASLDIIVVGGTNSIVISKAQIVVRRIKLDLVSTGETTCADDDVTSDDCAEVQAGPFLVDVPVTSGTVASFAANVPAGTYDEVDFRIHKPSDNNADADFLAENPNFANASIRVEGTYNGTPFVFTTDMTEKQEVEFAEPLVVDESGTVPNLTIQVDVSSWFRNGASVVNPATANKGGANENLVKENIRESFRAFRDDDKNGRQ